MKELNLFQAQEQNEQLVTVENDQVVTTSLRVAEHFGKRHCEVLRLINTLECSDLFRARNFALSYYERKNGNITRSYPMYYLTRDGFTFLAMGFTGKVAARFKEAFNQRIRQSIEAGRKRHGIYYGPCGNMLPTLPFHDDVDLESNLNNLLSFVNNSYLESMYFISEMSRREEELQELKKIIARFTREIQSQLKIY